MNNSENHNKRRRIQSSDECYEALETDSDKDDDAPIAHHRSRGPNKNRAPPRHSLSPSRRYSPSTRSGSAVPTATAGGSLFAHADTPSSAPTSTNPAAAATSSSIVLYASAVGIDAPSKASAAAPAFPLRPRPLRDSWPPQQQQQQQQLRYIIAERSRSISPARRTRSQMQRPSYGASSVRSMGFCCGWRLTLMPGWRRECGRGSRQIG